MKPACCITCPTARTAVLPSPWPVQQVDVSVCLLENLLHDIQLAVLGRNADALANLLLSLQTPAVLGLPGGYDPLMPIPPQLDLALPIGLKDCTMTQLLQRVVELLQRLCNSSQEAARLVVTWFPTIQRRYRERLESILSKPPTSVRALFWIHRLQDLLLVVRHTNFATPADEDHYQLWLACQQCINTLAALGDGFLIGRDLEKMFTEYSRQQSSPPVSDREARVMRRRIACLADQ